MRFEFHEVLDFWFGELSDSDRWSKGKLLDPIDPMVLVLAQESVRVGADTAVVEEKRQYFYMPFMHSESLRIHESASGLFAQLPRNLKYAVKHRAVIERFGRYPHRNAILGRVSTPEEIEFLKTPGSSFQ